MLCAGPSPSAKTIPCRQMDVSDLDGRLLFAVPKPCAAMRPVGAVFRLSPPSLSFSCVLLPNLARNFHFSRKQKGRLHEKALQLLAGADIQFHRKSRTDIALSSNLPIALVFLPAVDIAKFVGEGNVDLGITGQDVIAEAGEDTVGNVDEVLKLGFGKCRLCLQVPVSSPYREPRDLLGKKVATSFENLASRYFEKLGEEVAGSVPLNGVVKKSKTRVVSVSGSVEASCSLGLADGIGKVAR
ncbi:MAG: hypothetical protein BJ554DRAFT_4164 [Olpidium bornovanus]|uniref:ATP phosphoribosyltransferase n=1 Tax=Olpidium bornovanus TaxID=278681 RepID=A0A8H8DF47_9FUNG|nr:MAG: hypothetical protein BJ554DRAFT_4164 [Olpidium bornovanus]